MQLIASVITVIAFAVISQLLAIAVAVAVAVVVSAVVDY